MELRVTTDLTPLSTLNIQGNFAAVRAGLEDMLSPYASMVVDPAALSDAKKTRAAIRKMGDSIDALRREVKEQCLRPSRNFDEKCGELKGIINAAADNLDGQIKDVENAAKAQKKEALAAFFKNNCGDVLDYVSFGDVFDPRMLNATYTQREAEEEIMRRVEAVRSGLAAIRGMESPYEAAMLACFARTRDLSAALAEGRRMAEIERAEAERRENAVSEQFTEEEIADEATPPPPPVFVRPVAETAPVAPKEYTMRFVVTGTADAFAELKRCMTENNMKYQKI